MWQLLYLYKQLLFSWIIVINGIYFRHLIFSINAGKWNILLKHVFSGNMQFTDWAVQARMVYGPKRISVFCQRNIWCSIVWLQGFCYINKIINIICFFLSLCFIIFFIFFSYINSFIQPPVSFTKIPRYLYSYISLSIYIYVLIRVHERIIHDIVYLWIMWGSGLT